MQISKDIQMKIGLSLILVLSIVDGFSGSIPYIGTISNIIAEILTGIVAIWLISK